MTVGTITLGGREFTLRRFTLRENATAYPLARQVVASGVVDRWIDAIEGAGAAVDAARRGERLAGAGSIWEVSSEEIEQMADFVCLALQAADTEFDRDWFDDQPLSPRELLDAFFEARYCTGMWIRPEPAAAADAPDGEGGERPLEVGPGPDPETPERSTSGESSPS